MDGECAEDFVFITHDLILCPILSKAELCALKLPSIDSIESSKKKRLEPKFDRLEVILSLGLPPLHGLSYETSSACESKPDLVGEQHPQSSAHNLKVYGEGDLFTSNPEDAIVAVMFHLCSHWVVEDQITIVFHRSSIVRLVDKYVRNAPTSI